MKTKGKLVTFYGLPEKDIDDYVNHLALQLLTKKTKSVVVVNILLEFLLIIVLSI